MRYDKASQSYDYHKPFDVLHSLAQQKRLHPLTPVIVNTLTQFFLRARTEAQAKALKWNIIHKKEIPVHLLFEHHKPLLAILAEQELISLTYTPDEHTFKKLHPKKQHRTHNPHPTHP